MNRNVALLTILISSVATIGWAQAPTTDLADLSIEELMNIEVTSVAKKPQKLAEAPAAIYVLTGDDIRRSGATSIPEALRLVPGLQVARIDANKWAISARGFNSRFATKLLVLIDGRSVYSLDFSGVFWEAQDLLLEDIDRIEVIRGPGGTLWGANAVNGVINIVTKHTKNTQGGLLTTGAGTEEQAFGHLRYGGKLGENAWYRVYAKYFDRDGSTDASGNDTPDDWDARRAGFRIDWDPSPSDTLTFQGDIYDGDAGQEITIPAYTPPFATTLQDNIAFSGGNLLARWQRTLSDQSDLVLQFYYDRTEHNELVFIGTRDTLDLDFQHRFRPAHHHEILWGLGYRWTTDDLTNTPQISWDTQQRTDRVLSAFIQDEITLTPEQLLLTLGSKFEHNDYTGFELQPNARLLWKPSPHRTLWMAISRAVKTPSRANPDIQVTLSPPIPGIFPRITGLEDPKSETLLACELGYRAQPTERLSLDAAAFYNIYDNIGSLEPGQPFPETSPPPAHLILPTILDSQTKAETYGAELAADGKISDQWRLRAGYSCLIMQLHAKSGSRAAAPGQSEGESPQHQLFIHSSTDLASNLTLDLGLRYVDTLPTLNIESYLELDARLAWKPKDNLELFIVGQNLLSRHHTEYPPSFLETQATDVERGIYAGVSWCF